MPRSPARVLSTACTCLYAGAFVAPIKRRRFRFARSRRRLADVCCEGFSARHRIGGKRSVVGPAVGVWQAKDRGDRKCPRALVAKRTEVSKERNWCGWPGGHEATGQDPTHDHNSTKTKVVALRLARATAARERWQTAPTTQRHFLFFNVYPSPRRPLNTALSVFYHESRLIIFDRVPVCTREHHFINYPFCCCCFPTLTPPSTDLEQTHSPKIGPGY